MVWLGVHVTQQSILLAVDETESSDMVGIVKVLYMILVSLPDLQ